MFLEENIVKIFENFTDIDLDNFSFPGIDVHKSVMFDIETTGFSALTSHIYMIGCLYVEDERLKSCQYFVEDKEDEIPVLKLFFDLINKYHNLIHFNGDGFDIPFILTRCKKYDLPNNFDSINSIDIFKDTQCLKRILKLENHKQKTLERFLGLNRDDIYSGGDLIAVYNEYLKDKDDEKLSLLLLHNIEDIKGLVTLSKLYPYVLFLKGVFEISGYEINEYTNNEGKLTKEVIFNLKTEFDFTTRISGGYREFYMSAFGSTAKIKILLYTDELKYFYPNYKDYYYLPVEDVAIHKSVAFYVDKNFRTQAKAANCYSKKTGRFLPQYDTIISPYFKIDYNDKISYIELTDDFLEDKENVCKYLVHALKNICK